MPKYTAGIIRNAQIHCKRYKKCPNILQELQEMLKYAAVGIRNAQIYCRNYKKFSNTLQ